MIGWLEENRSETSEDESEGDCTVIDYVIRNEAGKRKIRRMETEMSIKLDHLSLELSIK